jgi:hypothetical protein
MAKQSRYSIEIFHFHGRLDSRSNTACVVQIRRLADAKGSDPPMHQRIRPARAAPPLGAGLLMPEQKTATLS